MASTAKPNPLRHGIGLSPSRIPKGQSHASTIRSRNTSMFYRHTRGAGSSHGKSLTHGGMELAISPSRIPKMANPMPQAFDQELFQWATTILGALSAATAKPNPSVTQTEFQPELKPSLSFKTRDYLEKRNSAIVTQMSFDVLTANQISEKISLCMSFLCFKMEYSNSFT